MKARNDFIAMRTAYFDSYGLVSKQRAEYICRKMKMLLETILSVIEENKRRDADA